jgi:hypothetical protein
MVAMALQADGWYLRSDIIWSKPNPMPESVTDRPTKSHEYLFLLSKSPRYYFDADAVAERSESGEGSRAGYAGYDKRATAMGREASGNEKPGMVALNGATRNIRSVWTIATQPYPGAHFATFPRKLVEPCIKAGTSERGVCPECGAPWERVVEREDSEPQRANYHGDGLVPRHRGGSGRAGGFYGIGETTGWQQFCGHYRDWFDPENGHGQGPHDPVPATILDPFAGSGTTGAVAQALGRRAVLIDLNPDYLAQAMKRNRDIPLGLGAA